MQMLRTRWLAMAALSFATAAAAQDTYPAKPVMVVVPQAPGGANDVVARILTTKLAAKLGRQVVVENRPGAGGNIGTAYVAKAAADGYTLLFTVSSAHVINPALYERTGFDPVRDFVPIGSVATAGYVLVANPSFPAGSVRELVDLARRKPDTITFATAGNGTLNHLIGEMIQHSAGIRLVHVPYKGAASAAADVVGGQVALSVQSLPSAQAFIRAGKLKVLAVTNEKRLPSMPGVPTVGETLREVGATPWYGLFAPANTPPAVVARLRGVLRNVLEDAEVRETLARQGCEPFVSEPRQFEALIRSDLARWAEVVRTAGATVN
ncbi:Bug family tripartite tricarboxylate transporter substrate binding protein [Cupriavidus necator]|uniref:Bug family tripartite tricarboxylate transporter substrate binding protein n=1 Tax=Cupriavidus necator TaxID=106590 RepID=UPI002787F94F|nr:tripartite tricarboxylate transporter substrate binding protein [Cupriavidus necator]MDQ0142049.1 tripartite-type tricarboxylate transporter receptor subunit TctC [Cupriavidus necator]